MKITNKALAINSILIVISVTLIVTIIHEFGHYIVALYFRFKPSLHHNYVNYDETIGTDTQNTIVAAAGPLISLIQGIIGLIVATKIKKPSLFKLFMQWFGMQGLLTFMGYFLIAPFIAQGDTGKIFAYFHVPTVVAIIIAILMFIWINLLFRKFAKQFIYYKNEATFNKIENAKQMFLLPIYSSIILVSLLSLPVVTWVSLLPTIFMPFTYFSVLGGYKKLNINDAPVEINKISAPLIIVCILSIIIFRVLV